MRKMMIIASLVIAASFANGDVVWDWWCGNSIKSPVVHLGLGCKASSVKAAEVSLCCNFTPVVTHGAQVCIGYNSAKDVKWVQGALVNRADSAKVQVGLLNFNKNGFLPFFPFVNLDKSLFD